MAIQLRKENKTFAEIGAALGVTAQMAHKIITGQIDALNDRLPNEIEELRRDQLTELRAIMGTLYRSALKGEVGKIDRFERLWARISKLCGLDAADKYELGGIGGGPIEVSDARARITAKVTQLAKKLREKA